MTDTIIVTYLNELRNISKGPATEQTYRPSLERLIRSLGDHTNRPVANVILEPGNITGVGAPDIRVYGPTRIELIGYVETKSLGKNLNTLSGHDLTQFNRFREALPIWIFTNFLDFRLYENGQVTKEVTLCSKQEVTGTVNLQQFARQKANDLQDLFHHFLQQSVPDIDDSRKLAKLLAHKALMLRDAAYALLTGGVPNDVLLSQFRVYQDWLIPDLTEEAFADLLAQTITYGLFLAAYENTNFDPPYAFTRSNLLLLMPDNIKPLNALFQLVVSGIMPKELLWFVDDSMYFLEHTNMSAITAQFAKGTSDPTIHFYEPFLSQYNPKLREKRGIYYTPDAVVSYMVCSVDNLLRQHFQKVDGLASPDVTLLDPALGTGTFIVRALHKIAENFGYAHAGDIPDHLRDYTLKRFYGFELLAAPYVLAHLKLGYTLAGLGLKNGKPQIYLTNTLSDHQPPSRLPGPFEIAISEDAKAAQKVKGQEKILVIIGNPPYAGHSANSSWEKKKGHKKNLTFIGRLHQSYYMVDGQLLGERNTKWLQNDYVKFIRWAEWKIVESQQAGYPHGVIAYITDHSYLKGPIFRGMRQHLLSNFSHIYILNLHGNTTRETLPVDVNVDENVFEIQQGTAILLLVRKLEHTGIAEVSYADVWGDQQFKYDYLHGNDVTTTEWTHLYPETPSYLFIPRDLPTLSASYEMWPQVTSLFRTKSMGIVTGRDKSDLIVHWSEQEVWQTINHFIALSSEEARETYHLGDDSRDWQVAMAQKDVRESGPTRTKLQPILYRPFDIRYTYYTGKSRGFHCMPRREVMDYLTHDDNLALITFRHTRRTTPMRVFVSQNIGDARLLSSESNCYVYPLYRSTSQQSNSVHVQIPLGMVDETPRELNMPSTLVTNLPQQYGSHVSPEEIFSYIYGVMNAPGYQRQFETLLKDDFPRIPFTSDYATFINMASLGQRLIELHTLKASDIQGLANRLVGYPMQGTNVVEKIYPMFDDIHERVYINSTQYFEGITQAMWNYKIGDYTPLSKWLDDRHALSLNATDRYHYETFATAIKKVLDELPKLNAVWEAISSGSWFNPLS